MQMSRLFDLDTVSLTSRHKNYDTYLRNCIVALQSRWWYKIKTLTKVFDEINMQISLFLLHTYVNSRLFAKAETTERHLLRTHLTLLKNLTNEKPWIKRNSQKNRFIYEFNYLFIRFNITMATFNIWQSKSMYEYFFKKRLQVGTTLNVFMQIWFQKLNVFKHGFFIVITLILLAVYVRNILFLFIVLEENPS